MVGRQVHGTSPDTVSSTLLHLVLGRVCISDIQLGGQPLVYVDTQEAGHIDTVEFVFVRYQNAVLTGISQA